MSFLDAIRTSLRNSFNFSGRARPSEYWWAALGFFGLTVVSGQLAKVAVVGPLLGLAWIAALVPMIAVTVRRLHDTGRSGAWFLVTFMPFVGGILLLVYTAMDSVPGTNRYGPSPKYTSRAPEEGLPSYESTRPVVPARIPDPLVRQAGSIRPRPAKAAGDAVSCQPARPAGSGAPGFVSSPKAQSADQDSSPKTAHANGLWVPLARPHTASGSLTMNQEGEPGGAR